VTPSPSPVTYGGTLTIAVSVVGNSVPPGGSVKLAVDDVAQGAFVTLVNGTATFTILVNTTTTLVAGSHLIGVLYSGDSHYSPQASSSNDVRLTVTQAPTVTTLVSSGNPATANQGEVFTATVTSGATGSVTFTIAGVTSFSVPLTGNQAATPVMSLPVGTYQVTAAYGGDANYAASTSTVLSQVVTLAPTTTTVTAPAANGSSVSGQPVTITVNVVSSGGSITGNVQFLDAGKLLSVVALTPIVQPGVPVTTSTASLSVSNLGVGPHSLSAQYLGSTIFAPSTASAVAFTVNKAATTVAVTSSVNPLVYGQPVTYTATVTTGATGTVDFFDGGVKLTAAPVTISGNTAQFTPAAPPAAGTHSISAAYNGDANFSASTSSALPVVINKAKTATTLAFSQSGGQITFTATISVTAPGSGIPTGTVTFFNGTSPIGTATITGSSATLAIAAYGNITATYGGDSNFSGSSSTAVNVPVPQSGLSLASSLNPSMLGQPVTFTASITVPNGIGNPTGTVQFSDGGSAIGSSAVAGGQASITVAKLTVGSHAISASYSGDGTFPASSTSIGQVVNRIASSLSVSAPSDIASGQAVTITVQLGPTPPAGVPAPTGQITLQDGGNSLGTVAASTTAASITVTSLDVGIHNIQASYAGDANWTGASGSASVTVKRGAITISTTSLPNGSVGAAYGVLLAASGGTPPYQWTISGLPPGVKGDAGGGISGTPTSDGPYTVTVQVTDHNGNTASATFTISITIQPLVITTNSLPDARADADYSAGFSASGGVPPYKWSGGGGGLSISSDGSLTGKPAATGSISITVQVTDSKGTSVSKQFTLNVTTTALTITSTGLPDGTVGLPYSQTVAASGGAPPYAWGGSLPAGLSIDPASGAISGTPSVSGPASLTVTVQDNAGNTASRTFSVNFAAPPVLVLIFKPGGGTTSPQSQPPLQITLNDPFPADLKGTLTLTFAADTGGDDQAVQFATGGRTASFTIPANSTAASFSIPNFALQTGTVAGLITLTAHLEAAGVDVTPTPIPSSQLRINPSAPFLNTPQAARTTSGFTVTVTGYSTTREVSQAIFHFNPATGANLQTTDVTIPVSSLFSTWFQSSAVTAFGSQFLFTQPFTVQGDTQSISSVTVTLVNSQGNSQPATAPIQ
jgi:hypothetical protein